nr:Mariner Mos1 transposase [Hymenolepis microstoma]
MLKAASGNFSVEDLHRGGVREKVVEDAELERFLVKTRVRLKKNYQNYWMGIIGYDSGRKISGYCVPHELKPRDVERRLFTCEQLVERQTRRDFSIVQLLETKNRYITITPGGAGGHTATSTPRPTEYPWLKSHALRLQQNGAVEACWAHSLEVRGSTTLRSVTDLPNQKGYRGGREKDDQQNGAVEACWAHSLEVRGSTTLRSVTDLPNQKGYRGGREKDDVLQAKRL